MSVDTVLRIKRKRTDDPLRLLLTQTEADQSAKKRRIWQLSRTSDSRGVPVPIANKQTETTDEVVTAPPRFSVRKRKASHEFEPRKTQRIVDLEREDPLEICDETRPTAENKALSSMLSEYLNAQTRVAPSTQASNADDEYVYDIYYPQATTDAIEAATAAINSNYGLLEHFDWEQLESLVVDEDGDVSEDHDSDDSNAEDYVGNDYPDEEDEFSSDEFGIVRSDSDVASDRDDWF